MLQAFWRRAFLLALSYRNFHPTQVALKEHVPLIFWGELSAEYTAYYSYDQPEQVDEEIQPLRESWHFCGRHVDPLGWFLR